MATAYWVSRMVYAAAKLSLADHLADGPKSATDLAGPTRTHEGSLYRLMRTLASLGVLTEDGNHRFALDASARRSSAALRGRREPPSLPWRASGGGEDGNSFSPASKPARPGWRKSLA